MAQSAKLQLRQSQGLALTPQLMQSIKLLQMSAADLNNFVQGEIEINPLLEFNLSSAEFPEERRDPSSGNEDKKQIANDQPVELATGNAEWEIKENLEQHGDNHDRSVGLNPSPAPLINNGIGAGANNLEYSGSANDLEAYVASQQSLTDCLMQQAALSFRKKNELRIAHRIIDHIDSDGYFRGKLETMCNLPVVDLVAVTRIFERVQKFDPPGVGARNLAECMQLQLIEKNRLDPAMRIFTENLALLAQKNYDKLAQLCGVDHDDLIDMAREIRELVPRPGDVFNPGAVQNVLPDVFVKENNDGSWHVELNNLTLPKVLINREYYSQIKDLGLKNSDKKFMTDNLQRANWLVASLDQRARTVLKVATEIVNQQDMFFVKGKEYLKPLTLKTIADKIDMHESTVSRVTSNKYLNCDRGIFEFKYFFMSGIASKDGTQNYGGQSVRLKIKNTIANETYDCVFSDEKIVKILSDEGIKIARRTVTKYRESLGLQSSIQRRRELKVLNRR